VIESLIAAGACDGFGDRAPLTAAVESVLGEAQLAQQEREAGQGTLFGDAPAEEQHRNGTLPEVKSWTEADRLAQEKEVLGFFISGHPLERWRIEAELFGSRTTATLAEWSEHQVQIASVVTGVKRQISKKTGKEYARLVLEDFHGTAEAIVFPDAWSKLNQTIVEDLAMLLTGGYSARDQGEERAPFIVESAEQLETLRNRGQVAVALRWNAPEPPPAEGLKAAIALCAAHPGPAPLYIEWSDGKGEMVRMRSKRLRVAPDEELVRALRGVLDRAEVHYVKAG
jgi:DNA polymerase-3 subunit alpha